MKRHDFISLINAASILLAGAAMAGCRTGLTRAAKEGDIAAMQKLLDQGANINASPTGGAIAGPPLGFAAYHCRIEAVKYLISKGADINNATGYTGYGYSGGGLRPLHLAASSGCTEAIGLLLDAGAGIDVRANETFGSALAIAAYHGHAKSVKFLIERGADVDDASRVLRRLADDRMNATGGKEGLALLQRFGQQKIAARPPDIAPSPVAVKSDVDEMPAAKAKTNKNSYAVVIGIEDYRQRLPKADYAAADAKTMTGYLTKVMGYPEENVVTLLNDHASNVDLVKYFEKWLPNNIEPNSTVFVYFSGHGAPNPKTGEAYLVPYDGDPSFIDETGYPLKRMYAALGKLPAKEIVVVLDSCFSGAGGRSVIAKGSRPLVTNLQRNMGLPKNMTVLSASSGDQTSSTYDEKGHGLFTYFILKGIKDEDVVMSDGSLKISDLHGYVKPQVERIARKQYNNEQTPQLIEPMRD